MKCLNYLLALILLMRSLTLHAATISDQDVDNSRLVNPYEGIFSYEAFASVGIQLPGFSLTADSGSLQHALNIQVSKLPYKNGMTMPSNMENVCVLSDGIRLLPNGEHFSEDAPAIVTLAYDPARIPMGYDPRDIYTYYSDDNTNWHRLARVSIDTIEHTIISYTTHFTDFANAIIKVPEMPENKAFVPTDMQDLPDPDPLVGIPMIAVPQANNMGTAELSYPIQLPPGRHGLQPDIDLHYSSAGGNGNLGVGWSMSTPAITVDTRWGVPRYDLKYETEAYLINGEPFLMHNTSGEAIPLPHMSHSFSPRSAQATQFYARDQRNQSKAVRHGQTPDKYWWSVTTTDGVTYYYGYDPYLQTIDENSILRTKKDYIGYWALTYVVDRFSNCIRYENSKDANNEILIQKIEYTGNPSQHIQPFYKIRFIYKGLRSDPQMDARLGLMRHQNHLLCQIHIQLGEANVPVTTYLLYYEAGDQSLWKSRLSSIAKVDGGISGYGECNIPVQDMQFILSSESWIRPEDILYNEITLEQPDYEHKPGCMTQFSYGNAYSPGAIFDSVQTLIPSPSNFSASRSEGWNVGGTASIGVGFNPAMTTFSAGANYSYTRSKGGVETMMIDMNGDGLLDRLYISNNAVMYERQLQQGHFAPAIQIPGLDRLSREISSSHTFGVQLDFAANLSYNPVISDSYTDIYFSDINGDGLPDLVTPEGVKINLLDSNNIPTFTAIADSIEGIEVNGNNCSKAITFNGQVDERLMCYMEYVCVDTLLLSEIQPSDDGEAPFIEYPMVPDSPEPEAPGEYEPHGWTPLPITEGSNTPAKSQAMEKDSLLKLYNTYVSTLPNVSDIRENTSAKITQPSNWADILNAYYQGDDYTFQLIHDTVFVYHKEFKCNPSYNEPNIDIVRVWVSDRNATVKIKSKASLIQDTTFSRIQARNADGVRLRIQWNKNVIEENDRLVADSVQMLYDNVIDAEDYDIDTASYILSVNTGDVLFFRLSARDNRRFDNIEWEQTVLSVSGDTLYNSSRDYLCTGNQSFTAPASGTARIILSCKNEQPTPVQVIAEMETTQIMSRLLPGNTSLDTVLYTSVIDSSQIFFRVDSLSVEPLWSKVHIIPEVDYWGSLVVDTAGTGSVLPDTLHYFPDVQLRHSSFYTSDTCLHRKLFGPLYHGWGWFAYNDVNHDNIIPIHALRNEENIMAQSVYSHMEAYRNDNAYTTLHDSTLTNAELKMKADSCFAAVPTYNPLSDDKRWVAMHPDYKNNQYLAYGNTGSIGQKRHSVSRQLQVVADSSIIRETIEEYDSPIPTLHGGMQRITTIRKSTHSVQHSLSYGISTPIGIGVSENVSFGSYDVTSDYMDMNGDGFPDFVGQSSIQYTRPWGGIGSLEGILPSSFSNSNSSAGIGFSASRPRPEHIPANGVKDSKMAFGGYGGGLSGQVGTDETHASLIDINADGLPDIIDADNDRVKYNLGYSFTDNWYAISNLSVATSSHKDASIMISSDAHFEYIWDIIQQGNIIKDYSLAQFSISGGISSSTSQNRSDTRLTDINGDGYPDLLSDNGNGSIYVRYNNGQSFGASYLLNTQNLQTSYTANLGFNLGVTAGIDLALIPIKFCFGIQTSPWNVSSSYGMTEFMDVNGDGYADQVIADDESLQVRYNKNGTTPVNLLTGITNPTGQTITISYELSAPSVNHRNRTWNMSCIHDSIPTNLDESSSHTYDFQYTDPFYDNFEKTDYGYARVLTTDNHTYRKDEDFENRHYINRGEIKSDILYNEHSEPIIGHRHGVDYADHHGLYQSDICDDIYLHVDNDGYWTDYYERYSLPQITTRFTKSYDLHHNLIHYFDYGDVAINGDEWQQFMQYKSTTSYNMISLPIVEVVKDGGGSILRRSRAKYNAEGKPFQIIRDDTNHHISSITVLRYDSLGNLVWLRAPGNENNEWSWRHFQYDNYTNTHVTNVFNQFVENRHYAYDLRFGKCSYSRDPAGNEMHWRYDRMGRLIDIVAPNEVYHNNPYTVHYIYRQPYHDFADDHHTSYFFPHVTKVSASNDSLASIDVTIYDARGQAYQRKSWRNVNGNYVWVTDGWRQRDAWYRPYRTCDPFITNISSIPLWEPDNVNVSSFVTSYEYDVMNRITYCQHPDTTWNSTTYGFSVDMNMRKRLLTENIDENAVRRQTLTAPQGWTIETRNIMDNSTTHYEYTPLGELGEVFDADNYRTKYGYDMFGNKTYRLHPDAGETYWRYAPDGSLISIRTARMSGSGDSIHYSYCFDKLMDIIYPRSSLNNVHYMYDVAGRMAYYEDRTGSTRLYYDRIGNVSMSLRRVVIPTESYVYTFRTRSNYDSFGRIREIIYPDGDHVNYNYYPSGELREVTRFPLLGPPMPVVTMMQYDEQGRNISRVYGNGVWTNYQYEPTRNRLIRSRTITPSCDLQDLNYKYDGVSNVSSIEQYCNNCGGMGGQYFNTYIYDAQNRLTGALSPSGSTFPYDFGANYSRAGRLGHGFCRNTSGVADEKPIYGYDNQRCTHQPRVIFDQESGRHTQFAWDANGNLALSWECADGLVRFHDWDDENRLGMMVDNKKAGFYAYDANGDRVYKLTGESNIRHPNNELSDADIKINDIVLYPNPYVTITPKSYTKHYYAGSERLASSIGQGGWCSMSSDVISDTQTEHEYRVQRHWNDMYINEFPFEYYHENPPVLTQNVDIYDGVFSELQYRCPVRHLRQLNISLGNINLLAVMQGLCGPQAQEDVIYYTHGDHLGSANWITDYHGVPVQYIHYLPYGQLLANQTPYGYDERYKFTGKERDAESGYDYFGARFYWSLFKHWLSVDPLADKYPNISPYAYCAWNPVKFVDPDGKDVTLAGSNKSSVTIKTDLVNLNVDISNLNVDFGGSYNFQGDEILSATLDIAGIFDPSGAADGLNALLQWNSGDIGGALTSVAGLLPYAGDLAKAGKVKKDIGVINNAIEAANKSLGNKYSNARKMTPKEINQFFGDKEWHDKNINKKSMINKFRKELKGSTNADMYIDRETKQIFLKGNKSNAWVDTGEVLQ